MTIGKRLFDMARAELNSLLDRAAGSLGVAGHGPTLTLAPTLTLTSIAVSAWMRFPMPSWRRSWSAATATAHARPARLLGQRGQVGAGASAHQAAKAISPELARAYAALEVPYGADFQVVRRSYRALMRKYHPDRHAGAPAQQKTATELAQQLTLAYKLILRRTRTHQP